MSRLLVLEEKVSALYQKFIASPLGYFHEKELHAELYGLARDALGTATPLGAFAPVHLLRYEYDTVWRYKGQGAQPGPFRQRFDAEGTTGCLDFALLKESFVRSSGLLTVVNKDEGRRKALRAIGGSESPVIEAGLEMKMLHLRTSLAILGDVNDFAGSMQTDARKLALEGIREPYLLGFSHGPWPELADAERIARDCRDHYRAYFSTGNVRILIAGPKTTVLLGNWHDPSWFGTPHCIA